MILWIMNLGFGGSEPAVVVWTEQSDESTTWSAQADESTTWTEQ